VSQLVETQTLDTSRLGWSLPGHTTTTTVAASNAFLTLPALYSMVAPLHHYFKECSVCYDLKEFKAKGSFAEFCFSTFRVTGDSTTVEGPRHPHTVCAPCLQAHATSAIRSGKLFAKCPLQGCGRSLQTLELKKVVGAEDYALLVARLKEAEDGVVPDEREALDSLGLELRLCPKCHVRIEKNEVRGRDSVF